MPSINIQKGTACGAPTQSPSLIILFLSFFKLGTISFGGPPMVAYIRTMVVEKKKWLDDKSLQDGIALCQMIPGIITMQTVAYLGLQLQGIAGAAVCFAGFGLPAFILMMMFSALYMRTYSLPPVVSAFHGLQAIIVALVAHATYSFGRTSLKNRQDIIIAAAALSLFLTGVHPILTIILSAVMGMLFFYKQTFHADRTDRLEPSHSRKAFLFILFISAAGIVLLFFTQQSLFSLVLLMMKITAFSFGGGFTALPLMFHEVVTVRSWMDTQTLLNGIALGQITPGPITLTATFIGYYLYGFSGGLVATLGVFLPSFLIVVGIAPFYNILRTSPTFTHMTRGILCSFVGLLLSVTIHFAQNISWDISRTFLASTACVALLLKVEIVWVVLTAIVISFFVL